MATMKAVILDEDATSLSVERVEVPAPGPDEVRVAVEACGISRTVENGIQGKLSGTTTLTPRIPGQEFAGVIDAVGADVDDVAVSDRVVGYVYVICGECDPCRRGDTGQCVDRQGKVGVTRNGAYAEYVVVPAENVLLRPEGAGPIEGVVASDGLATALHAANRAHIDDRDTVLVIGGAGRIGTHMAKLARLRGANVIAADTYEDRLAYTERVVDDVRVVSTLGDDFPDRVRELTPHADGPGVVTDTVGHSPTISAAWDTMIAGGRFVSFTTNHQHVFDVPLREFVVKEGTLLGTKYATKDEVMRALRLLADGRIGPVIRGTVGFEEVATVHRQIRDDEIHGLTVLEP